MDCHISNRGECRKSFHFAHFTIDILDYHFWFIGLTGRPYMSDLTLILRCPCFLSTFVFYKKLTKHLSLFSSDRRHNTLFGSIFLLNCVSVKTFLYFQRQKTQYFGSTAARCFRPTMSGEEKNKRFLFLCFCFNQ